MPTKKDLTALLSDSPQQPLRRGRGLRLSQASKQARELVSKSAILPETASQTDVSAPIVQPAVERADAAVAAAALPSAPALVPEVAAVTAPPSALRAENAPEPPAPERDKRKLQLRKDLLKQCKRIARAQDRKLYQVIESAMEEYIQRHGAHE